MKQEHKPSHNGINEYDLAESMYRLFVQSMEAHYSEIIKFLAIIVPSLTGFFFMLTQYESAEPTSRPVLAFAFVAFAVVAIQVWGAIYALAMSYRFRYLQASVHKIEEARGVSQYLPKSFKPKPVTGKCARLSLSVAPMILQVHVFFFIVTTIVIGVVSCFALEPIQFKVLTVVVTVIAVLFIFGMGALYFPNKLNAVLTSLGEDSTASN